MYEKAKQEHAQCYAGLQVAAEGFLSNASPSVLLLCVRLWSQLSLDCFEMFMSVALENAVLPCKVRKSRKGTCPPPPPKYLGRAQV